MFYSVRGMLVHTEPNLAVIECGGVAFKCFTTTQTMQKLPARGQEARLYTYLSVREDALDLYGFASREELNCFKLLISVSGVGAKSALAVLSDLTPDRFALCVAAGDSQALTRAPGIGKKIAQRIVLELKDKVAAGIGTVSQPSGEAAEGIASAAGAAQEAVSALSVLGFAPSEAAAAVAKLDSSLPVEELIRLSLKSMSGGR